MGPPASALCPLPPASAFKTSIGRASAPGGERRRSAQATENPPPLYSTLCLQLVLPCSCPPALYHAMIWGVRYLRGWRSVAECNKTLEVYASLRFVREKESSTAASSRAGSRSASIVLKNPAPCPCPVPSVLCPLPSILCLCRLPGCPLPGCPLPGCPLLGCPPPKCQICWISRTNIVKFEGIAYLLPDVPGFDGFPEKHRQI